MRKLPAKAWWRSPAKLFLGLNLSFILIIFLLSLRPGVFRLQPTSSDLASYNGYKLEITSRICEEADVDYKSRRLTICLDNGFPGPGGSKTHGQVLVTTNLYPRFDYGDYLRISGELKEPPKIDGFDYEGYLARYDIYSVMYYPKITRFTGTLTRPQKAYRLLIFIKQGIKAIVDKNLPEPEAGLANALLLGYRRTVDREDLDIFSRVGLSHMIAISGSHITILSTMIIDFFLACGLKRRSAWRAVFAFLILYPFVTGLAASAVRSAIMGGLAFLAIYNQRSSSLIRALVFAAALMLAGNPKLLRDDIGFQLSFLAILGIIYIYPLFEAAAKNLIDRYKFQRHLKNKIKNIFDIVSLTLVSQLVIFPISLINFKQFSVVAPLANVLVLWTFAPLLAALIIAIFLTVIIPGSGILWFLPAYLLLKFIFYISRLLASPQWAAIPVSNIDWSFGSVYYVILILLACLWHRQKNKKQKNHYI